MALKTAQQITYAGIVPTLTAAALTDTFYPDERTFYLVSNGSGAPITVTLVVPGLALGVARPDVAFTVAAGADRRIGPLTPGLGDPVTGLISITHSAITSVTGAQIRV